MVSSPSVLVRSFVENYARVKNEILTSKAATALLTLESVFEARSPTLLFKEPTFDHKEDI